MAKVTVVIPWRAVPSRVPAFEKLIKFYKKKFPEFEVIPSDSIGEKYNISQSRNLGAKRAIDNGADIIIFNDADTFASPESINLAIKNSLENNEITAAFNRLHQHYNAKETNLFFRQFDYKLNIGEIVPPPTLPADGTMPTRWHPCSGVIAVPKNIFLELGGFEESIEDWGPEDVLFHKNYFLKYGKLFHYVEGNSHSTYNDPSYRVIKPEHSKYLYG